MRYDTDHDISLAQCQRADSIFELHPIDAEPIRLFAERPPRMALMGPSRARQET